MVLTADEDAQHLIALGRTLTDNISTYLESLGSSGLPPPSFRPGTATAVPTESVGFNAHRAIIDAAERIIALTTGPAGLYDISRQSFEVTAINIAVDLNLPLVLPLAQPMSAQQLAVITGADETIIVRIMRALTPLFIFEEISPQTYRHTARSASMRDSGVKALMMFGGTECMRAAAHLPEALKDAGYQNMTEPTKTAFGRAYGTNLGFFDYLNKHPEMGVRFGDAMAGTVKLSYEVGCIADIFPFERLAQHGGKIVDVGGGKGHVMISIGRRYPRADLRFIVQDFASAVDTGREECPADLSHKFEWAALDFLAGEQPVKRAAAYFLRHILHDWSDRYCARILKPIVAAMEPSVSRLLVTDMIVPEMNAPKTLAHRDLLMMAHLAGAERTAAQYVRILKEVDPAIELVKIWALSPSLPGCGARVMEFVLWL